LLPYFSLAFVSAFVRVKFAHLKFNEVTINENGIVNFPAGVKKEYQINIRKIFDTALLEVGGAKQSAYP
jgi:hypothetical protein